MPIKLLFSHSLTTALLLLKKEMSALKGIGSPNNRRQLRDIPLGSSGRNKLP
jgi:hypothetical protein